MSSVSEFGSQNYRKSIAKQFCASHGGIEMQTSPEVLAGLIQKVLEELTVTEATESRRRERSCIRR